MRANSKKFQLVSSKHASSPSKTKNGNDDVINEQMVENMGKVGVTESKICHISQFSVKLKIGMVKVSI